MSNLPTTKAVDLTLNDEWLTILFNQPEKRNALTEELTSDIKSVLGSIKAVSYTHLTLPTIYSV